MARRSSSRSRGGANKTERAPRGARSRKGSSGGGGGAAAVEEESSGGGEAGVAIMTTVVLVVALVCVDMLLGRYDAGIFF